MGCGPLRVSVVIPAYNEGRRIGPSLRRVREYLDTHYGAGGYEIIVVDDGSSDDTAQVVEQFGAHTPELRLIRLPRNSGKGAAVRAGMLGAAGDAILFCDADLSTPIEEVEHALKLLGEGSDVVIGSRALAESEILVHQNPLRESLGRLFNLLLRLFLRIPFRDTQCGFKLFGREAARAIFQRARIDGFAFDVETILLAWRLGFTVREIPVRWLNDPDTKVTMLRHPARMLVDLWRMRRMFGGRRLPRRD